jgi:hypothetical protein
MIAVTAAGKSSQLNEETTSPSPPVRTPHPLEAWAEPRSPFEPVISRPLLGGYLSATRSALEKFQRGEERVKQFAGLRLLHASELARQRREREDERERQAAPDPRGMLCAAITLRTRRRSEGASNCRSLSPKRVGSRAEWEVPQRRKGLSRERRLSWGDRGFDSSSLQRRACELSVPRRRTLFSIVAPL